MKRLIAILIFIVTSFLLFSCDALFKKEYTFFGVVQYDELSKMVGVNIINTGFCDIPASDNISAVVGDTVVENYTLSEGDIIKITFRGEVSLMESYPARFSGTAESIVAYPVGVRLDYHEDGYLFTEPRFPKYQNVTVGDTVSYHKDGIEYVTGTVASLDENTVSILLSITDSSVLLEFISVYPAEFSK